MQTDVENINNISSNKEIKHILFVFDMDFTILNENTDYEIRDLIPKNIRDEISKIKFKNWGEEVNAYMDKCLELNISLEKIKERIQKVPLTPGMKEIFDYISSLKNNKDYFVECLVISGANMLFVEWILQKYELLHIVNAYYSFNCNSDEGKLVVSPFHSHECKICDKFLCKKKVMKDHIAGVLLGNNKDNKEGINKFGNLNIKFDKVFYFGDGGNDICPANGLNELPLNSVNKLIFFCRKNFRAHEILFNEKGLSKLGKEFSSCIELWDDGYDLLKLIKKDIE